MKSNEPTTSMEFSDCSLYDGVVVHRTAGVIFFLPEAEREYPEGTKIDVKILYQVKLPGVNVQ